MVIRAGLISSRLVWRVLESLALGAKSAVRVYQQTYLDGGRQLLMAFGAVLVSSRLGECWSLWLRGQNRLSESIKNTLMRWKAVQDDYLGWIDFLSFRRVLESLPLGARWDGSGREKDMGTLRRMHCYGAGSDSSRLVQGL